MIVVAILVAWAASQDGFPVTHWTPGALVVLALLLVTWHVLGLRAQELPLSVRIALGCLVAYTALSYLSILWANVPGDAWEGANRTLLYLLVFALFACWPLTGAMASLLLCLWVAGMIGVGLFVLVHLAGAGEGEIERLLPYGRLLFPSGYPNANAAQWLIAFWPALLLARSVRLAPAVRGALSGGCVLFALLALLSQSRGSFYATPIMLILVFALVPGRARTFAALIPVAAGIALAAPSTLKVSSRLQAGLSARPELHTAITTTLVAAVAVALVVFLAAELERRLAVTGAPRIRARRAVGTVAVLGGVAALAAGWLALGNPVARAEHAWSTFRGGDSEETPNGSRLISGLGSSRYDVYRVALDELLVHPVIGIGVDNFEQEYLVHGRSLESPHYPHSVELRTLVETGLVGALLAIGGLAGALVAAIGGIRRRAQSDPLGAQAAVAALAGFCYWTIHGSFDWFFEYAGLGASAFALLGIACGLAARRSDGGRWRPTSVARRSLLLALGALLAVAAFVSLGLPWLSQLEIERAARIWPSSSAAAYSRLERAASLDPLSDEADSVAGSIAVREGELLRAQRFFTKALQRTPGDAYVTLELGAIASESNHPVRALGLLRRAVSLDPRQAQFENALQAARRGLRINVQQLNRAFLLEGQQR